MKPKAIVFDFDGVLTVGGEEVKDEAWDMLVKTWSPAATAALRRNQDIFSEGRGSRDHILRGTFLELGYGERDIGFLIEAYSTAYNRLAQRLILATGMPDMTLEVLDELTHTAPIFINSATPETAVTESAVAFDIAKYFTGIFGQPKGKVENLERARGVAECSPGDIVFVGDGTGDRKAALAFGCRFIGISNARNGWTLSGESFPVIEKLADLPQAVRDL